MDGFLLIDKECGLTSFDVVSKIKRKLSLKKVGHTGTLDPFASGLLILCTNRATKLAQIFLELPKTYEATFVFGEEKDTHDRCGTTTANSNKTPTLLEIEQAITNFKGEILQIPPKFSALKINGKRAYKLAREGKDFELKPKKKFIYSYHIIRYENNHLKVKIQCSSGTYIRSLARDLGRAVDSYAFVDELKRTHIGDFSINKTKLISNTTINDIQKLEEALNFLPNLTVKKEAIPKIKNGVPFQSHFLIETKSNLNGYYVIVNPKKEIVSVLNNNKYIFINN